MNNSMQPLIKFENLTKQYGKNLILKNLNLEINKGELFGFIGMSGSGKTTILNTLIGFLEPEEGDILFHGSGNSYKSVFKNSKEVRRKFGFATQIASFYPKLTIEENLFHFGSLYNLPKKIKKNNVDNLLRLIGLESEKKQLAQSLSGGMEKRLGIACSLIHNPEVLILDEPTANLDPVLRESTWKLIKDINKMGTTIIVASHLLEELEPVCDRIGIIHNKSIMEVGTPDQLKSNYIKNDEIILKASGKHNEIKKLMKSTRYVYDIKEKDDKLVFYTKSTKNTLSNILHLLNRLNENIISLEVTNPSLKEVFELIHNK